MDSSKAAGDSGTRPGIRVVGLDPGSRIAGWGAVDETDGRLRVVDFGVVRCPPRDSLVLRLHRLHREIGQVIKRLHPDEVAVESVFSAASAGAALTLGHARGAVLAAAADFPVAEYSPRSVKQALTGYGAAGKGSVAGMVARRLGMVEPPDAEDAADALAVAICHLDARRAEARLARAASGRPR
ncbi:MAG: crossover junction endodeoxyribonuclease RuvC [Acidobacteria bacterium]|nr:crossover junction endodeoxyribonuclease RuvC [Acidobacteriota bacterium]MXX86390.1 crossover junction endodeoxyribonuclease RuvC [Acidobacteriota bacterium]MYG74119.1 crossover junction endodeoxyribonuclease RuvC [Acidobacteriota bacterium]